jgi:hypothetical protein
MISYQKDWECRRSEISELIQRYQLGCPPNKPATSVKRELLENGLQERHIHR